MVRTIAAVFLILHGLTHAILTLVPSPKASDAGVATFYSGLGSWLLARLGLAEPATRTIAILLSAVAAAGFVAAGLALFGTLVPFDWWRTLASASAVVSLLLVVTFWDRTLIVGLLIDVATIALLLTARQPA